MVAWEKFTHTQHIINLWSSMPPDITEGSEIQIRFDIYE